MKLQVVVSIITMLHSYKMYEYCTTLYYSVAEPAPHQFGIAGVAAGAVTRCGSGSDGSGSKSDIQHTVQIFKKMSQIATVYYFSYSNLQQFQS
jgi:hypothetical protein